MAPDSPSSSMGLEDPAEVRPKERKSEATPIIVDDDAVENHAASISQAKPTTEDAVKIWGDILGRGKSCQDKSA